MKIVEQSHQFLRESDPIKLIEVCGRTCYKSEDKITEDSAERFVKMITKSGHYSVLEHANVCFGIHEEAMNYIQLSEHGRFLRTTWGKKRCLISGNFRAWLEFFCKEPFDRLPTIIKGIWDYLNFQYPAVFPAPPSFNIPGLVTLIPEEQMAPFEKLVHATRTCRFITDRGVTHEMVRHRSQWAYSQESTRYVNYGNKGMQFILPVWMDSIWAGDWSDYETAWRSRFNRKDEDWMIAPSEWLWACKNARVSYEDLLGKGWKPEQARSVLPNSLKTEIVCTAPLSEWKHMLDLRTSKAAHPQIRHLLTPVLSELQEELPEVFK